MKLTREVVKEPDVVITMSLEEAKAIYKYLCDAPGPKDDAGWTDEVARLYDLLGEKLPQ